MRYIKVTGTCERGSGNIMDEMLDTFSKGCEFKSHQCQAATAGNLINALNHQLLAFVVEINVNHFE